MSEKPTINDVIKRLEDRNQTITTAMYDAIRMLKSIERVTTKEIQRAGFSDHIGYNFGKVADDLNARIFGKGK